MKKRELFELIIEDMNFGGESIGTYEDKKVILKGGITGQKIKGMIRKIRKDKIEGKILSIIEKSDIETEVVCPHYGKCGGCSMLSVCYKKQLEIKKNQLLKLFHDSGHAEIDSIEVVGSPKSTEYKNKMEFTFGDEEKGGELGLGLHMKGSATNIIYVYDCMLVDEDYRTIIKTTVEYFRTKNIPHYKIFSHVGFLRHLIIREGKNTGEIQVNIVTTSQMEFNLDEYKDILLATSLDGHITGVLHTVNDSLSDAVIPEKINILFGEEIITEKILDKEFVISPFSFFQTNTGGSEVLYKEAIDMIEDNKKEIFDLYSGTGTIAILMAEKANQIYGIEIIQEAVEMAKKNAVINNINNCKFIAGDVAKEVSKLTVSPELIILDPPRAGIHPGAMSDILNFNSDEILYISCNPKSLMNDLTIMKKNSYNIQKIKAVDMFPNTPHVEVIIYMKKQ